MNALAWYYRTAGNGRLELKTLNRSVALADDLFFKVPGLGPQGFTQSICHIDHAEAAKSVFEKLVASKNHMALVVDEYGSVSGLVTMEDVIETLLGLEIMDESDNVSDLQLLARKSWEERAKKLGILNEDNFEN